MCMCVRERESLQFYFILKCVHLCSCFHVLPCFERELLNLNFLRLMVILAGILILNFGKLFARVLYIIHISCIYIYMRESECMCVCVCEREREMKRRIGVIHIVDIHIYITHIYIYIYI